MEFSKYVLESKADLVALATAIKQKTGKSDNLTVSQMKEAVEGIEVGGGEVVEPVIIPLEITENDTYTAPEGVDGYSPITVNVAGGSGATVASLIDCSITEVDIPKSATSIRSYLFSNCRSLNRVTIPETVTQIEDQAFAYTGLESIVFPRSLTEVGDRIVDGCSYMHTIAFRGTPNGIPSYAFYLCPVEHIYVPWREGDLSGAPWGAYDATVHYCKYNRVVGVEGYIDFTGYGHAKYYCIEKPNGEVLRYQEGSLPVLIDGVGDANYWNYSANSGENYYYTGWYSDRFRFTEPGRFYFWIETADGVVVFYAVYNVIKAPVNRVDFTVDYSYSYCAEAGMTWAQWCNSGYNTDDFRIEGNSVLTSWGDTVSQFFGGGDNVSPSDVITAKVYGLNYALPSV